MKFSILLRAFAVLWLALAVSCQSGEPTVDRPEGVTVLVGSRPTVKEASLFPFDNRSIPFTQNVGLELHPPRKYPGNPVLPRGPEGAPDEFGVQFYGSVVRHEGKFKLWYVAIGRDPFTVVEKDMMWTPRVDIIPLKWRAAYAESPDGIHWTRPALGLEEYGGSRDNNLVAMEPAPLGVINLKVIHDPEDPDPSRQFKMSLHTWWHEDGKKGLGTLAPAVSGDGLRWRLAVPGTPRNGLLPKESTVIPTDHFEAAGGLYKWDGLFYASGQGARPVYAVDSWGRSVGTYRSPDFVRWEHTGTLSFSREGQHKKVPSGSGEESHEGISVWNRGNVLLGLYGVWHGSPDWRGRTVDLGFVVSNDGVHFREPLTDFVFIRRGEDHEWDQGGLIQGQGFENVGEETCIWYGAWDPGSLEPRGGVGLAKLERDRLGSFSVRDDSIPAAFMTAAIEVRGKAKLWVNAEGVSEGATLRLELYDALERPLAGYSGEEAAVVTESGLRTPVSWPGGNGIPSMETPFKVKVSFEGAEVAGIRVYALYAGT